MAPLETPDDVFEHARKRISEKSGRSPDWEAILAAEPRGKSRSRSEYRSRASRYASELEKLKEFRDNKKREHEAKTQEVRSRPGLENLPDWLASRGASGELNEGPALLTVLDDGVQELDELQVCAAILAE